MEGARQAHQRAQAVAERRSALTAAFAAAGMQLEQWSWRLTGFHAFVQRGEGSAEQLLAQAQGLSGAQQPCCGAGRRCCCAVRSCSGHVWCRPITHCLSLGWLHWQPRSVCSGKSVPGRWCRRIMHCLRVRQAGWLLRPNRQRWQRRMRIPATVALCLARLQRCSGAALPPKFCNRCTSVRDTC